MAVSEYNHYQAPAPFRDFHVLAINEFEGKLLINVYGFCSQVSLAVRSIVMGDNRDLLEIFNSSPFQNIFYDFSNLASISEPYDASLNLSEWLDRPVCCKFFDNCPCICFVDYFDDVAKALTIEALKAAYLDVCSSFGPSLFLKHSIELVRTVASGIFNFKEGNRAFTHFCKSVLLPFEDFLYLERAGMLELEQAS